MTTWNPNTTSLQLLQLRVRELDNTIPLSCSIFYGGSDTWKSGQTTGSDVYYDDNDFLNLSMSISIPYNELYSIQIYQQSASLATYKELYRGELLATTQSVDIRTSETFMSYTGSTKEYIIYE